MTEQTHTTSGRPFALAITGLLLTLAGPVAYMLLMDHPSLRRNGLAAWVLAGTGLVLVIAALMKAHLAKKRTRVYVASAFQILLLALYVVAFFKLAAVPKATAADLATAPAFTLQNQEKETISLKGVLAEQRALLVFFRGHW